MHTMRVSSKTPHAHVYRLAMLLLGVLFVPLIMQQLC